MELVEHRFDELSRLQYRIFTCDLGGKHNPTALVLKFSGVYGVGSAGNGDAALMTVITRAATSVWPSQAAVFDLRELAYEWEILFGRCSAGAWNHQASRACRVSWLSPTCVGADSRPARDLFRRCSMILTRPFPSWPSPHNDCSQGWTAGRNRPNHALQRSAAATKEK